MSESGDKKFQQRNIKKHNKDLLTESESDKENQKFDREITIEKVGK